MTAGFSGPSSPGATAPQRKGGRRTLLFSLIAASVLFLSPLLFVPLTGAQEKEGWRSLGLRGETVLTMSAVNGENGTVLFAQTPSGLWRRNGDAAGGNDGPAVWARIDDGLPHSPLGAPLLAAWRTVPGRPLQLYALAGPEDARQLYRSDDGGSSWLSINPAPGSTRSPAMVVLPGLDRTSDTIFIGTPNRVQVSLDGGATWAPGGTWPVTSDESEPVVELAAEVTGADRLLALERSGRLWRSDSGGLSWHDVGDDRTHSAIAVAPYFALGIWAATAEGVIRSVDDGATWSTLPLPGEERNWMGGTAAQVQALAVDPRTPETVYAAFPAGTYRHGSGDAGWQFLGSPATAPVTRLAVDPATRTALYAATGDGVWVRPVVADQPTATPTSVPVIEATATTAPTATETASATPTATPTVTASATSTPSMTATDTTTPTATPTATPSPRPTRRPTMTATPTITVSPTPTEGPAQPPPGPTSKPAPVEPPPPVLTVLPR